MIIAYIHVPVFAEIDSADVIEVAGDDVAWHSSAYATAVLTPHCQP